MILERLNWVMMSYLEFSPCHRVIMTALKPGWVIQVIQVRPGLKIIWVWPRLDHVSHKLRKYNMEATFALWATPTFQNNDFACCKCTHPLFLCICMQQLPFTACSEPCPLLLQELHHCSMPRPKYSRIACMKPLPSIQAMFLCLEIYG